jgi:hypothetical protein
VQKSTRSTRRTESWWQLRIELLDVSPRVWRRVLVPDTIILPKLDRVIRATVGWTNSHLHEFVIGGVRYGVPDPDFARELAHVDEKGIRLEEALGPNARCFDYVYDFGDDWHHVVIAENQHAHAADAIRCTDGENACPPEDVGGAHGYEEFLKAIGDPKHDEHRNFLSWVGGSFDANKFDIHAVNGALAEITPR